MARLLFLIPRLSDGGAERVVSNLTLELVKNNQVVICVFSTITGVQYSYGGHLLDLKAPYSRNPETNNAFQKMIRLFYLAKVVRRVKRDLRIDTCISFTDNANVVNVLSRRFAKVVLSIRSFRSKADKRRNFYGKLFEILTKILFNYADKIVVPSKEMKIDLISNYGIKKDIISCIYNPYNIQWIQNQGQEEIPDTLQSFFTNPVIINVGRITHAKGQWHLIRIFNEARKQIAGLKLVIIGRADGGEQQLVDYMNSLCEEYGMSYIHFSDSKLIQDYNEFDIIFLGHQPNPFKYISRSTLFAFPSIYEGFPNALVEALLVGTPAISSDCYSGPREVLAPDTDIFNKTNSLEIAKYGILVATPEGNYPPSSSPLSDSELNWLKSILQLLKNNELRLKFQTNMTGAFQNLNQGEISTKWEHIF